MGRQGGLRLQSTLSRIRDWAPPPPERDSDYESEDEVEEDERADTDEENLLFSDDDCVVTSGEEDSDSEEEQEEGPVLSAAEVLASREAALRSANGNAVPAAPASLASMKRTLGGPPVVPPRAGDAASSTGRVGNSKFPPVAGSNGRGGRGRITSRVKKV